MLDLLWRSCSRWTLRPHHLTGDSIYGSLQNIRAVEDADVRAFVPAKDWTHNFPGSFSKKVFRSVLITIGTPRTENSLPSTAVILSRLRH